jgi:hypothetical protein
MKIQEVNMDKINSNNIYTKLKNIQGESAEILKDNTNKFQNYKYFTEYQALTFLKPLLNKESLSLHFEDLKDDSHDYKVEQVDYKKKDGSVEKQWMVQYWKQANLTNSENPTEKITSKFLALGSNQDIAKAKGSAETYAVKYFLTKFFLIPVADNLDPDKEQWKTSSISELSKDEKVQVEEFFNKHK